MTGRRLFETVFSRSLIFSRKKKKKGKGKRERKAMEQKSNRSRSQWTEIIKLSNVENRCARIIEKYVGEMKRSALVQMIFDDDKRQNAGKTFIALLFLICRACPSLLSSSSLSKIFFNQEWKERGLKLKLNGNVRRISLFRRNCIVILSSCCHSYRIIIP